MDFRFYGDIDDVDDSSIVFDRSSRTVYLFKPRLNPEDEIALRFSRILEKLRIEYVVVAGYIAILFGRGRRTEDLDFIVMPLTEDMFVDLCREVSEEGFTLMQGDVRLESSVRSVYRDYLAKGYSVRFMYGDVIFPNVEFKFSSTTIHKHALNNSYRVVINDEHTVKISPPELQIVYKLYLGSDKDVGDAVFLYTLLKDDIDVNELERWCRELKVNCSVLEGV